jgi:hypothetical protein
MEVMFMSKFVALSFIGSEKEISKIVDSTIGTLEREYKLKINQEVIIPAMVNCFLDAAIYESLVMLGEDKVRSELNLFEMIRIIHEIIPGEEKPELLTIISLGRMAIRRLELELPEEDVEEAMNSIVDVDIKLLEQISLRAIQYLEDRHGLLIRDYQIMFKVAEVFLNEMISFIKVNSVTDDTLVVFDQFSIVLDDSGRFESIEISDFTQKTIVAIHEGVLSEIHRLKVEDDEFAESNSKHK